MTSARAWHVAMVAAMVAMLVLPVRRDAALLQLLLFCGGLGWCVAHLVASGARRVHLRLGAGFVAMVVMLTPTVFAPASAATSVMSMTSMPAMAGVHESHTGGPVWLSWVLLAVMAWSCWPEGLRISRDAEA